MDLGLSDRVYVVTGASGGLGGACAEQLVAEGARLVLSGRDETALAKTAALLGGPERAIPVAGDLTDPGIETCLVAAAVARYGRLDGVLVSVGQPDPVTALETEDGAWRLGFESYFLAPLRLARAVARAVSHEGGSVLMVLSTSVREPVEGMAVANAMRPALAMAAKTLADELGPRNVRVNGILPGHVDTERSRSLDEAGGRPDEVRKLHESRIPLARYGDPLEFARPAVFLLSPAAGYVTGTLLTVDGGRTRAL
jgi:3-oxoacyl-[acyl-carrier protein] reductase